ncbi:MAG: hypothetical protein FWG74_04285 [Planctomycetes bacterium]|nr:hypothetical protein [Planctomycetota bacterium]
MAPEFKSCPNRELNKEMCNCPKTDCANHSICCRCVANHQTQKNLPFCFREQK